jgi:Lon protease-like protein
MDSQKKIVPLFPLEKVVLFPRALLSIQMPPLQKVLGLGDYITQDAEICFGVARQTEEQTSPDDIPLSSTYRTACIGRVVNKDVKGDHKYRLLIEGVERVRILREIRQKPVVQVEVEVLHDFVDVTRKSDMNRELGELLSLTRQMGDMVSQYNPIIKSIIAAYPHPAIIADLITYTFIKDAYAKLCVLEELDALRRIRLVTVQMRALLTTVTRQHNRDSH